MVINIQVYDQAVMTRAQEAIRGLLRELLNGYV